MASLDEDIEATDTIVGRSAPWLRLAQLPERLAAAAYAPEAFRTELKEAHAELVERFRADESVESLVHARAELIDAVLREVWRSQLPAGYGSWAATVAASCIRTPTSTSSSSCRRPRTMPGVAWSSAWSPSSGTSTSRWATACAPSKNAPRKARPTSA
jgi:hypothetical protein